MRAFVSLLTLDGVIVEVRPNPVGQYEVYCPECEELVVDDLPFVAAVDHAQDHVTSSHPMAGS